MLNAIKMTADKNSVCVLFGTESKIYFYLETCLKRLAFPLKSTGFLFHEIYRDAPEGAMDKNASQDGM